MNRTPSKMVLDDEYPIVVVGVGSSHSDDVAGWLVVQELIGSPRFPSSILARKAASPIDVLHFSEAAQHLILADACHGGGDVGEIHHWRWPDKQITEGVWSGTHDFPLPAVLQLGDQLNRLPPRVDVYGIEGTSSAAVGPSPEVVASARSLAMKIRLDLASGAEQHPSGQRYA